MDSALERLPMQSCRSESANHLKWNRCNFTRWNQLHVKETTCPLHVHYKKHNTALTQRADPKQIWEKDWTKRNPDASPATRAFPDQVTCSHCARPSEAENNVLLRKRRRVATAHRVHSEAHVTRQKAAKTTCQCPMFPLRLIPLTCNRLNVSANICSGSAKPTTRGHDSNFRN